MRIVLEDLIELIELLLELLVAVDQPLGLHVQKHVSDRELLEVLLEYQGVLRLGRLLLRLRIQELGLTGAVD